MWWALGLYQLLLPALINGNPPVTRMVLRFRSTRDKWSHPDVFKLEDRLYERGDTPVYLCVLCRLHSGSKGFIVRLQTRFARIH